MQNSIFNIFGTTSTFTKSTNGNGNGPIIRGPGKPNTTEPAPKKVLGDLRSNILCNVDNSNKLLQPSSSKEGVKNIRSQKDLQCKPDTSFRLQTRIPKKVVLGNKVENKSKPKNENIIHATVSRSESKQCVNVQDTVHSGFGSVIPRDLQLTAEDMDTILGGLTSFCIKPDEIVWPELRLLEDDPIDIPKTPGPLIPFTAWMDLPDVPLPSSQ